MKKYLPIILLALGIVVFVIVLLVVKKGGGGATDEDASLADVSFMQRPVASLTPSEDGHWLTLAINEITLAKTDSVDYELLYTLPDGRTQGVPGAVKLEGANKVERKLLLGSESSGKFRYDEGVEEGSLTVRLRDAKGKLLAKFSTKFHLQTGDTKLTSVDGVFSYTLPSISKGAWFVTMETFSLPGDAVDGVASGPYGVFSSISLPSGEVDSSWSRTGDYFYKI